MSQERRTFRVFISSTFADLVAERDALQTTVYPHLRKLCAQYGCRFQAIDLRSTQSGPGAPCAVRSLRRRLMSSRLALLSYFTPNSAERWG